MGLKLMYASCMMRNSAGHSRDAMDMQRDDVDQRDDVYIEKYCVDIEKAFWQ